MLIFPFKLTDLLISIQDDIYGISMCTIISGDLLLLVLQDKSSFVDIIWLTDGCLSPYSSPHGSIYKSSVLNV